MSSLLGVPVDAAYHVVSALANVLVPLLGGFAAVAGIILFTAAVRLAVTPLTFRALRGQAAQARLAPHVQRLRERYGKQPERLQRELTALQAREGTSLFAGFGPLLVQWPVFSVVYLLFRSPAIAGAPNRLLTGDLFGVPLGAHWLSGSAVLSVHGAVFVGVLALLGAACWLLARTARRVMPAIVPAKTGVPGATNPPAIPGWLTTVLPYLTVVIAAFAPLAAVIYLITSTTWSAAERRLFAARARAAAR